MPGVGAIPSHASFMHRFNSACLGTAEWQAQSPLRFLSSTVNTVNCGLSTVNFFGINTYKKLGGGGHGMSGKCISHRATFALGYTSQVPKGGPHEALVFFSTRLPVLRKHRRPEIAARWPGGILPALDSVHQPVPLPGVQPAVFRMAVRLARAAQRFTRGAGPQPSRAHRPQITPMLVQPEDPGKSIIKKSLVKNPLLYSTSVVVVAALGVVWVMVSRWEENRAIERRANAERAERQKEQDRVTLEQMGGKELAIQNFYAIPGVIRRGESTQLCTGWPTRRA